MKKLFSIASMLVVLFFVANTSFADCLGCCSGHGGVVCDDGITLCKDGESLSQACVDKGCNKCGDPITSRATTIKIASWNIENFGVTKAKDKKRMEIIADKLKDYDIIAVQEVSNVNEIVDENCSRNANSEKHKNHNLIRKVLEKYLNEKYKRNYKFLFSPQVKDERYLYIYDADDITLIEVYLADDSGESGEICASKKDNYGLMVRQPYIATFRAGKFDFTLITAHTSPSINVDELNGLEIFYRQVEAKGEPDVIVLGDLNADGTYLKPTDNISFRNGSYTWIIKDDEDTTVASSDNAYDRFIFKTATKEDFTGNYGIVSDITDDISDHKLVWAEFYTNKDSN